MEEEEGKTSHYSPENFCLISFIKISQSNRPESVKTDVAANTLSWFLKKILKSVSSSCVTFHLEQLTIRS